MGSGSEEFSLRKVYELRLQHGRSSSNIGWVGVTRYPEELVILKCGNDFENSVLNKKGGFLRPIYRPMKCDLVVSDEVLGVDDVLDHVTNAVNGLGCL